MSSRIFTDVSEERKAVTGPVHFSVLLKINVSKKMLFAVLTVVNKLVNKSRPPSCKQGRLVSSYVLAATSMKMAVLWVVAPRNLISSDRHSS